MSTDTKLTLREFLKRLEPSKHNKITLKWGASCTGLEWAEIDTITKLLDENIQQFTFSKGIEIILAPRGTK